MFNEKLMVVFVRIFKILKVNISPDRSTLVNKHQPLNFSIIYLSELFIIKGNTHLPQ